MKRCIYVFRHGTTTDNMNGVFSGWRDVGLTIKGRRDAQIVAERLKDKSIDVAFHSSLKRSKDTLKEVLMYHPECQTIIEDDRIIERKYGLLQGKTHVSIVQKKGVEQYDTWHRGYAVRPPRGESLKDVEKRVRSFLRDLLKMMKKQKVHVAVSAHGNSMRPLRKYFEKLSVSEMCHIYNSYEQVYVYEVEV